MKVLVVGGGGREHAIAWHLSRSPRVTELFCAPGNAGIAKIATCIDIGAADIDRLVSFSNEVGIDLAVIGPEDPLCRGIVDRFEAEGLRVFGPTKDAAEIERSKVFSKQIMTRYLIPTAQARFYDDHGRAMSYVEIADYPLVIKADGLAAGKGVFVCADFDAATEALKVCMIDSRFGDSGATVLVEDFLQGAEASVLAFTDGKTIAVLPTARDYKRAFDHDAGPNTGGMGSFSPADTLSQETMDQVVGQILVPVVHAMNREGRTFKGVLYTGLMITKGGPKVVEFNCRFGDPEAQAVLMRLKTDLVDIIDAVLDGNLADIELEFDERHACCVVMASENYPESSPLGAVIEGLEDVEMGEEVQVFHGGTALRGDKPVTAGGRVLGVTALGQDLADSRARAYTAAGKISWPGARMRADIGT